MASISKLTIISFFIVYGSSQAFGFLDQALVRKSRSPQFQRIFVNYYLAKAQESYEEFVSSLSEKEFREHLELSTFGRLLYTYLANTQLGIKHDSALENLQGYFKSLTRLEFARMKNRISFYYDSGSFDERIYAVTLQYASRYQVLMSNLVQKNMSVEDFRFEESRLLEGIQSLDLDPSTQEIIQDLLFIEFQLKG